MRVGVIFPQTEIGTDPIVLRDYAQAAEGLGYSHLLAFDHVLGAHPDRPGGWNRPYNFETIFHEPLVLFGYLAGLTSSIEFVTGILILPQRQTALVAKQAAEVDVLSGGRLRLGVAVGWNDVEYEALGEDFEHRGSRLVEQMTVLRRLWTEEAVEFKGKWHTISKAGIRPLPVQRPIPLWMGGMSEPVIKRVARLSDGWFPQFRPGDASARETMDRLHGYIAEAGRQIEDVGIEGRGSLQGTPEDWIANIEAWRGLGATHLGLDTMRAGLASPRDHIDAIRRFKEAVAQAAF